MEQITLPNNHIPEALLPEQVEAAFSIEENIQSSSAAKPFIEANTIPSTLEEIRNNHIIPVFIKDNETLISQAEFIDITMDCVSSVYSAERILSPSIRLSHPIKGRVPSAKEKPVNALQDHEKTLYYERMAFVIEIPSIQATIDGHTLSLMVGGVKAYNLDNLYSRKGSEEHFKVFIGFQNTVCTNLCVWTDGLLGCLKVKNSNQLHAAIHSLFNSFNPSYQLYHLGELSKYSLTETQFALLLGRCRLYPFLPKKDQREITPLLFGDSQIKNVAQYYYKDSSFCRAENGDINLWKLYNLLTSGNKSTYIDSFVDRNVAAYHFTEQIKSALVHKDDNWFLN
jgi:hypothetical protein